MAGEIGQAIKKARKLRGATARDIADPLGLTVQAVYNWEKEKGGNSPSTDNALAVAEILRVEREPFLRGEVILLADDAPPPLAPKTPELELALGVPTLDQISGPRDVAELGVSVGGDSGDFTLNGQTIGYVSRPASLRGRDVFAVRVRGESMFPRYEDGDLLYVERHREPRPNEDGVFEMKPSDEWGAGHAFVKNLVSKGIGGVTVRQFNPADQFTYKRDQIRHMYRVVPRNELLSV